MSVRFWEGWGTPWGVGKTKEGVGRVGDRIGGVVQPCRGVLAVRKRQSENVKTRTESPTNKERQSTFIRHHGWGMRNDRDRG